MNAHTSVVSPATSPSPAPELPDASLAFRAAMRKLAGAVSVLTVGVGDGRTGLTATSVTALSVEPPTLLITINRGGSSLGPVLQERVFAINVLRPHHQPVADRFAGKGGLKGPARYEGADWTKLTTGAPVLADALAAFDCELEDAIERHSHVIVIGRVVASRITENADPLLYWAGGYRGLAL
ncbi:flavin reductase family protein [Xanthobacter agilis]|uniref:Flavin reductase (DIM6/NTAB) family NADH-FMN oxidoreductase RutF n=1 Tax=Xanthobacter agilis TaxID=47492 RepID=A0ABU0LIE3_XANAG|nr:flavin reductase family protein [Xanthobacter agilis]MDQ0506899.1 flavin reductase (DIM6/NTAB) family NADH-FMN oxidoreductase RutF [Xanthobacter agilis]